ncbi:MAG: glutamine--fructose-6-phosphate aminotransferase, partial [Planctomycetota bacterium]|nr:glutamine--fructose-6-phosphate aminotransferase [Planctomycetota bacterium]
MCGIVGYVGSGCAVEAVLKGLALLEYRGYDSAGLAAVAGGRMRTVRTVGRVSDLAVRVAAASLSGARLAVGHTRWATHGRVSESNAHPHLDASGNVAIVHNGIIENSDTLRREMEGRGIVFASETDTEVAAQLIGELYCGDLVEAVERAIERLEGSFALAVVSPRHPDLIVGARRGPPLACAVSEAAAMLASDALPLSAISGRVAYLEEDQVAALFPGKLSVRRRGVRAEPAFKEIKWSRTGADLCGFPHYMLKEIHEQPASLRRLCSRLIADRGGDGAGGAPGSFPRFNLENLN